MTTVTGFKIALKLFINTPNYLYRAYDYLETQIYDHFEFAMDILDDNKETIEYDKIDNIIQRTVVTANIIDIICENRKELTDKELGEYVKKNELDYGIIYDLNCMFEDITFSSTFDIDTATIHITITDIDKAKYNKDIYTINALKDNIMKNSLEDGIYEGCYDEGTGYDIYQNADIDISALNSMFKRFKCLENEDKLSNAYTKLSVHCGIIDYRKDECVIIEEIRS